MRLRNYQTDNLEALNASSVFNTPFYVCSVRTNDEEYLEGCLTVFSFGRIRKAGGILVVVRLQTPKVFVRKGFHT